MSQSTAPAPDFMEQLAANRARAERVAAHFNLWFFVASGTRYEYRGHRSEERDATEEEVELWNIIDGLVPEETSTP